MVTMNDLPARFATWLIFINAITPVSLRFNPNNILTAIDAKPVYELC